MNRLGEYAAEYNIFFAKNVDTTYLLSLGFYLYKKYGVHFKGFFSFGGQV